MNDLIQTTIENFQSHKKTVINWAPGGQLTILTGPSDSGKTAILRAEDWLCNNKPDGNDFIRVGCTFARVTNVYKSGHTVIRERTSSKNQYKIIEPGANQPLILEGFGRNTVPLEVQEITGIKPVTIGDMEYNLNLAAQLDGPFLGNSVSAPARAKMLGKLAGTEEIDYAQKNVEADIRNSGQHVNTLKAELDGLDAEIAKYDYLPTMAAKIAELERLAGLIQAAEERRDQIFGVKKGLELFDQVIRGHKITIERFKNFDMAEALLISFQNIYTKNKNLSEIVSSLAKIDRDVIQNQMIINKHQNVDTAFGTLCLIQSAISIRDSVYSVKQQITGFDVLINQSNQIINRLTGLDQAITLYEQIRNTAFRDHSLSVTKDYLDLKDQEIDYANQDLRRNANVETCIDLHVKIQNLNDRRSLIRSIGGYLKSFDVEIDRVKQVNIYYENRVIELEKAYKDALVQAGICPMCGTEVDPMTVHCAAA